MPRAGNSIILITVLTSTVTLARSPNPDLIKAAVLYQHTEYGRAIDALKVRPDRDAAENALLGKACFMEGQYKQAVAALEKSIEADQFNSDSYDWLGKAYGRLAEEANFLSALGYAKKTVRSFERAVELSPSNLEALCDVFEYYLQAPGIVGGGVDKAAAIAKRIGTLNEAEYHWARARLAETRGDVEAAEREYRAALNAAPSDVGRTLDLAGFLCSHGRYSESEALFRTAEEKYPNSPKVLYAEAAAHLQSKRRLDYAEMLLRKYLQLRTTPEDPSRREAVTLLKTVQALNAKLHQAD